ncbi:MAG: RES family NAD+ phosphorylase [Ferruginibacter sp.]|nr:RES family NAD+ phosphorylase [Rhodoferax sp.]
MNPVDIDPDWITQSLAEHEHGLESDVWRAIDTQDAVATLRLLDTLEELLVLEQILAGSLPILPPDTAHLHPLLSTPFRFTAPQPSRFRPAQAPGIWYGADSPEAACAELGYWRWRFLLDSEGLHNAELVGTHTLFHAVVAGHCLNLDSPPWNALVAQWSHPTDIRACQALAGLAQTSEKPVQWIRYPSARSPGGHCAAVFDPQALTVVAPHAQETWVIKISAQRLIFSHAQQRLAVETADWV